MKRIYISILLIISAALAAVSCRMEEPAFSESETEEITPVTVSLKLGFASEDNGTPLTKAIDDPTPVVNTHIRNMCVLQYKGTSMDSPLVGQVHYLREDVDPEDENYLDFNKIKLADSWGETHTLVFLTNTFAQIPNVETLGEMLQLWHNSGGEAGVFGHDGDGTSFPDDVTYYQRMNALAVTVVDNGTVVRGVLRRSMARINVEIVNNGADNLKIVSAQLRNVSQKDYYVTDYSYIDPTDGVTPINLIDEPFQDEYHPLVPLRTDYVARTWAQGGGTNDGSVNPGEGTGTANFRWYVPSNMRGTDNSNHSKEEKNVCPNAYAATYLYILASYGANDEPILYRFYLGENLVNNFDIKPNTSYSYRLTFNGKGNTTTDKRVEDLGTRKFEYDANCYILNPPPIGDRVFSFNVVHRPNVFWGNPANEGVRYQEVYDAFSSNFIRTTEHWFARVLWSDYPYSADEMNAMLVNKTGTGAGNYDDDISRVKVKIPSNIVRGNIVIGVWANDDGNPETNKDEILWSWHLWITDYQPDRIFGHTPVAGTYIYNVEGGQVHRYNNTMWNTGSLKNGYAMDRNIGTQDPNYHTTDRLGGFYYQFGRKDPFSGNFTGYSYNYECTARENVGFNNGATPGGETGQNWKNVPWSVMHPRQYITGSKWTGSDIFSVMGIPWHDPEINGLTAPEERGKSIFDPCPRGWKVPANGWLTGFGSSNFVWNGHNLGNGRTYYPNGGYEANKNKDVLEAQAIFFPSVGSRNTSGGVAGSSGDGGVYWSSTPYSTTRGYIISFYKQGMYNPFDVEQGNAYVVRCVHE